MPRSSLCAPLRYALPALLLSLSPLLHAADFFVSKEGKDAWSGTLPSANADRSDGPFATFERAKTALQAARKSGAPGPHRIQVRTGTYSIQTPIRLEAIDSGEPGQPVLWEAFPGERPILTGSVFPVGWTVWKGAIHRAPLGQIASQQGGVRQVLLGGERQILARYPNFDPKDPVAGGWAFADGEPWPMYEDKPGENKHTLLVRPQDLRQWAKPSEVQLNVFPRFNWWNSLSPIKAIDPATRQIELAKDCSYAIRKGDRYFFQNALEELDAPGEWYADLQEAMLYYWLPEGRQLSELSVVSAPSLLLLEKGTHDVIWRGFTMEGSQQSAIVLNQTARCIIEKNHIRCVGEWNGHGVDVQQGHANRIRRNVFEGIGNSAIVLSGGDIENLIRADNVAEHNEIHHFGHYFKQGVGIHLSGAGNRAVHNLIHHGPRFGILHSGCIHDIGFNHIHDVCLETEDAGAIYSNGRDWLTGRGTLIHHNFVHDIPGFGIWDGKPVTPHFAFGIYLDDGTGGADVLSNISVRCGRGGIHAHSARDSVVRNNIFAQNLSWQADLHGWTSDSRFWLQHLDTMSKGYEKVASNPAWKEMRGIGRHPKDFPLSNGLTTRGNRFERNILYSDKAEIPVLDVVRIPLEENHFDYNLVWAPGGEVQTNFHALGPDEGPNLAAPWSGEAGQIPHGWHWTQKPDHIAKAAKIVLAAWSGEGVGIELSARAEPETTPDPANRDQIAVSGSPIPLECGASYRLRAQMRASEPGTAQIGVHCFVPQKPFWMSPGSHREVATSWRDFEIPFTVPKPGTKAWHDQMQHFNIRFGWKANHGTLQIRNVQLHRASAESSWTAWRQNGTDVHSLVADPQFKDLQTFGLNPHSPAFELGFVPIPFEDIGPQPEP